MERVGLEQTVVLQDLEAGYGSHRVLHGVDLVVGSGLHVVLGPNGAGKTTLFRVIGGVLPPWKGTVQLLGHDPHRRPEVKQRVAYLTHRKGLYNGLNVRDNLLYWARTMAVPRARVAEVADELALGELMHQQISELSHGQSQRVAIARMLLGDPELLLLDEPTTGMDPSHARQLRQRLTDLAGAGRALLYSTHNLYEAADLAEDVVVLSGGRIISRGSIEELQRQFTQRRRHALKLAPSEGADPEQILQNLGYSATREGAYWVLELDHARDVSEIVRAVVDAGASVLEVRELENPLETLYLELDRQKGESDG